MTALVESLSPRHGLRRGRRPPRPGRRDDAFLLLEEALRRSLSPVHDGTEPDADPQAPAPTDPVWSGGSVTVHGSRILEAPRSLLAAVLLGVRSRRAERTGPDRLV